MTKNFYLLRHGESTYNVAGRIQGQSDDSVLTENGRCQAEEAATRLEGKNIEIIISSPLKRAIETGKIVSNTINAPMIFDSRFIEVNIGVIEGMYYEDVMKKYKSAYQEWQSSNTTNIGMHFKNGESKIDVRHRVFEALNHYAENTKYQNILISGHGIILNQALMELGEEQQNIPNCAIIHLKYDNKRWSFAGFVK